MDRIEIVYKTFEGWKAKTTGCQKWEDLPDRAREYVIFIEQRIGIKVKWIGTGPRREDMVAR